MMISLQSPHHHNWQVHVERDLAITTGCANCTYMHAMVAADREGFDKTVNLLPNLKIGPIIYVIYIVRTCT